MSDAPKSILLGKIKSTTDLTTKLPKECYEPERFIERKSALDLHTDEVEKFYSLVSVLKQKVGAMVYDPQSEKRKPKHSHISKRSIFEVLLFVRTHRIEEVNDQLLKLISKLRK